MTGTQVATVPAVINGTETTKNSTPKKNIESVHLKATVAGTDSVLSVVSTVANGNGDSKKLSKDMDKKEITVNGGKVGDSVVPTTPHKLPQQAYSSSGTILKNDCIDLDNNLVAVDLKNLKENSLLVNNLKSLGVGVRGPLNTTTTNGTTMKSNATNSAKGPSTETDDETSDSDHGSEDETERLLRFKFERERADIAWRWHWLDLQSRELQFQIQQADQQYLKLRRGKQPVAPPVEDNDTMHALRTSGMGILKKSRKMCRRAPTNLSGRIVEGADTHPLFSFSDRKGSRLTASNKEPGSPVTSPVKLEPPKRRRDSSRKKEAETKEVIKTEAEDVEVATRPVRKRRNTKDESPQSPLFTPPTTPNATPKLSSEKKKKTLKARDFDIDNVVIPFGMGAPCSIPVIQYKEIITPKWRSVDAPEFSEASKQRSKKRKAASTTTTPEASPRPSPSLSVSAESIPTSPKVVILQPPPFKRFSSITTTTTTTTTVTTTTTPSDQEASAAPVVKCERSENPPAKFTLLTEEQQQASGSESSGEDTSDEAFARRHLKQEVSERQRYLQPKKKSSTDGVTTDAITDLFVTTEDLLSTYSPNHSGSLLPSVFFSEPNGDPPSVVSPTDEVRTGSLSVKKEKLKEKFAKMRHSYGGENDAHNENNHRIARTSSAPSSLSSKPAREASSPETTDTESESDVTPDEELEVKVKGEEEYVERKRSRKYQPIRTRSRARQAEAEAAAAAALAKSKSKSRSKSRSKPKSAEEEEEYVEGENKRSKKRSSSPQKKVPSPLPTATKKVHRKSSAPAPASTPDPTQPPADVSNPSSPLSTLVSRCVPTPVPTPTAELEVSAVELPIDDYLSDDWDAWEESCDKTNKWWWEPANWEIIPSVEESQNDADSLLIHLRRVSVLSPLSSVDVPTPTFPVTTPEDTSPLSSTATECATVYSPSSTADCPVIVDTPFQTLPTTGEETPPAAQSTSDIVMTEAGNQPIVNDGVQEITVGTLPTDVVLPADSVTATVVLPTINEALEGQISMDYTDGAGIPAVELPDLDAASTYDAMSVSYDTADATATEFETSTDIDLATTDLDTSTSDAGAATFDTSMEVVASTYATADFTHTDGSAAMDSIAQPTEDTAGELMDSTIPFIGEEIDSTAPSNSGESVNTEVGNTEGTYTSETYTLDSTTYHTIGEPITGDWDILEPSAHSASDATEADPIAHDVGRFIPTEVGYIAAEVGPTKDEVEMDTSTETIGEPIDTYAQMESPTKTTTKLHTNINQNTHTETNGVLDEHTDIYIHPFSSSSSSSSYAASASLPQQPNITENSHPSSSASSPPTTPPLIASPDDDIILLSPLRSDSDDCLPYPPPPPLSTPHTTTNATNTSTHHTTTATNHPASVVFQTPTPDLT